MVSVNRGVQPRFGPSKRILELAQHKTSKTVWATTPCEKLHWGNQEPIRPISAAALRAVPSARIQYLSRHKRDFSAREDHRRKEEAASFFRKSQRPSSKTSQYENTLRLSTPRAKRRSSQEAGPLHSPHCDINCPIWHIDPGLRTVAMSPRLLLLSEPKRTHPEFLGNQEISASTVSFSSRTARVSKRVSQLSLPRLKESKICHKLGHTEESIWSVSEAAKKATASERLETLAEPKQLHKDYVPPREPEWRRKNVRFT